MGTAEIFPALFICPMWRVIHLPHTYLWPIYGVPGMVLSVRLSEFLVKLMDKSLPSGHFLRPTWLFVKTVLVTNWLLHFLLTKAFHGSSSLCFIFSCGKKNTTWNGQRKCLWQRVKVQLLFSSSAVNQLCNLGQLNPYLWFSVSVCEMKMRWQLTSLPAPR